MVEHGGSSCSHPGDDAVSVTFDELLSGIPHDPASTLLKCDIEGAEVYLTSAILARYLAYRVELHIDNSLAAVSPDVAWLQQLIPPLLSGGYCGLTPLYPIRIDGPSPSTMVRGYLIGGRLNALSCHE